MRKVLRVLCTLYMGVKSTFQTECGKKKKKKEYIIYEVHTTKTRGFKEQFFFFF